MLLLYDNLEHLLAGTSLVKDILQSAGEVRVLATSRVRLGLNEEHLFHLGGMEFPDGPLDVAARPAGSRETPVDALRYSAVRLFMQGARRARPGFELAGKDGRHVTHICRLVGGMPLGILLAAAWLEMLTPAEIAAEIERGMDVLMPATRPTAPTLGSFAAALTGPAGGPG